MSNQTPLHGAEHTFTMFTPAYMQLSTGTAYTKPEYSAADAFFEGVKAEYSFAVDAVAGDFTTGTGFTFSTPESTYCFYNAAAAPSIDGVNKYVQVLNAVANPSQAAIIAAMKDAVSVIDDIVFSETSSSFNLKAKQGGYAPAATASDSLLTVTEVTAGSCVGGWSKIGLLADDITATPEAEMGESSEKKQYKKATNLSIEFSLLNVSQRAYDIIKTQWDGQDVDVAFFDQRDVLKPAVIYRNVLCNATLDAINRDGARIKFQFGSVVKRNSTFEQFWTFEDNA